MDRKQRTAYSEIKRINKKHNSIKFEQEQQTLHQNI